MIVAIAAVVVMAPLTYLVWRSFLQIRASREQTGVPADTSAPQPA
jgi:hypothetical protein